MADLNNKEQLYKDFQDKLREDRLQARPLIDELVRIAPRGYLEERARYFIVNKEFDLAKADIESLIELDPTNGLFASARFNYFNGDHLVANSHLEALIELRNEELSSASGDEVCRKEFLLAECYLLRAKWHEDMGQLELAAADYKLTNSVLPGCLAPRIEFCKKHGLEADLLDSLNEGVKNHRDSLIDRAEYHERHGNFDAAMEDYNEAVRKFPVAHIKVEYSPLARAHFLRAKFLQRRSRYAAALWAFCLTFLIGAFFWLLIVPALYILGFIAKAILPLANLLIAKLDKLRASSNSQ